jgi:hypothetical protein
MTTGDRTHRLPAWPAPPTAPEEGAVFKRSAVLVFGLGNTHLSVIVWGYCWLIVRGVCGF